MNLVNGIGCIVCGGTLVVGFAIRLELSGILFGLGYLILGVIFLRKSKHITK